MKKRELENKWGFDVKWRTGPSQDNTLILTLTSKRQEKGKKTGGRNRDKDEKYQGGDYGEMTDAYRMTNNRYKKTTGRNVGLRNVFFMSGLHPFSRNDSARRSSVDDFWIRTSDVRENKLRVERQMIPTRRGCRETIRFTFKTFIDAVANTALIHKPWPKYPHVHISWVTSMLESRTTSFAHDSPSEKHTVMLN